uniref:Uncharacterized protein n=1 Tax=Grammatophora oceanica TaxID=210454 RepID=A0A7S1UPJ0_9STRA|mmetsp:Transcript_16028/g.23683  ORF Transcript_16028/g.23683 Transcript_16028/m.23683 type:complete len:105 (+) Transcript_16028:309-623(+)
MMQISSPSPLPHLLLFRLGTPRDTSQVSFTDTIDFVKSEKTVIGQAGAVGFIRTQHESLATYRTDMPIRWKRLEERTMARTSLSTSPVSSARRKEKKGHVAGTD